MFRLISLLTKCIIGILFIVAGVLYGANSHEVAYKNIGQGIIAHYLSSVDPPNHTGYLQMLNSPTLYTVNERDFSPIINSIDTLKDGSIISFTYRLDATTDVRDAHSNVGNTQQIRTRLQGKAYAVVQLTLFDNSGKNPQVFTSSQYSQHPHNFYENDWVVGGVMAAIGLAILAWLFIPRWRRNNKRSVKKTPAMPRLVFLIDVDNTLIANDEVRNNLDAQLKVELGSTLTAHFWALYEEVRQKTGVVDIPQTFAQLRERTPLTELDGQALHRAHALFNDYPFFKALYPHALETLQYLSTLGLTVIVSDGDQIFQGNKIVRSGLSEAVDGRVLIYVHKQEHLDEVMEQYPADHYVMIDDKPEILTDSQAIMGKRLTTAFVEQGKYAASEKPVHFAPDITVAHIADLQDYQAGDFWGSGGKVNG